MIRDEFGIDWNILRQEYEFFDTKISGAVITTTDFRNRISSIIADNDDITFAYVAKQLDKDHPTLSTLVGKWMKKSNYRNTSKRRHGLFTRNNHATKGEAVREYIEDGVTQSSLSEKYGVSIGTIQNWVNKMKHTYKDDINYPADVPFIVKEEKMFYTHEAASRYEAECLANISSGKKYVKEQEDKLKKHLEAEATKIAQKLKALS